MGKWIPFDLQKPIFSKEAFEALGRQTEIDIQIIETFNKIHRLLGIEV